MDLKQFMRDFVRKRNKNLETVAHEIDVNRSRLYRLLAENTAMPLDIRDAIADNLRMNESERAEFFRLVKENAAMEDAEAEADDTFNAFIFDREDPDLLFPNINIQLIHYHESSRLTVSLSDFEKFFQSKGKLTIYACDCFYRNFLDMLLRLVNAQPGNLLNHLINIDSGDWMDNINIMSFVFEHARYLPYHPYINENAQKSEHRLNDAFFIMTSHECYYGEVQTGRISFFTTRRNSATAAFTQNRFDVAILTQFRNIREILLSTEASTAMEADMQANTEKTADTKDKASTAAKTDTADKALAKSKPETITKVAAKTTSTKYKALQNSLKSYISLNQRLISLSSTYDNILLKANMCYDGIPPLVYHSLFHNVVDKIDFGLSEEENQETKSIINQLVNMLDVRYSLKNCEGKRETWDFYTTGGLKEFADTGKLSDQIEHLPDFSDYTGDILKSLLDNTENYSPGLRYKICKNDFFSKRYILTCYREQGFVLEYGTPSKGNTKHSPYHQQTETICLLKLKELSDSFWRKVVSDEFIQKEAMQDAEAHQFLTQLQQPV